MDQLLARTAEIPFPCSESTAVPAEEPPAEDTHWFGTNLREAFWILRSLWRKD